MKKNKRVVSKARVFSVIDRIQRRLNYLDNLEDSPSLYKQDRWQSVVTVAQVERTINMLVTLEISHGALAPLDCISLFSDVGLKPPKRKLRKVTFSV